MSKAKDAANARIFLRKAVDCGRLIVWVTMDASVI